MEDSLDVVPVWIEDKCSVVTWVVAALTGTTVVTPAGANGGPVKRLNCEPIRRLEGQMDPGDLPFYLVDPQLVARNMALAFNEDVGPPKSEKDGAVEALAGFQIRHSQVHVIDEPTDVELHGARLVV